jgi:hypothetical protein
VEAEPFTQGDPRFGPGDFVRQITFVGPSPIGVGIGSYGVEMSYQHFCRLFRESIVNEARGTMLVQVRTAMAKGNETTRLKVRPELETRLALNLRLSLAEEHIDPILAATEDDVWTELASVLSGDAWSTPEMLEEWKRAVRSSRGDPEKLENLVAGDVIEIRGEPMSAKARYRPAGRSVTNFRRLQRAVREGRRSRRCPSWRTRECRAPRAQAAAPAGSGGPDRRWLTSNCYRASSRLVSSIAP